jgi:acyl-CoA thioesterase
MAAVAGSETRAPRSLAMTLLAPVRAGEVDVAPVAERTGRTVAAASVRLRQSGATAAVGMATFGSARSGPRRLDRRMPDVPPPERCEPLGGEPVPGSEGLPIEHRPAAAPLPLSGSDEARIVVWMRLSEDRPIDALSALVLADGAVPALYGCLDRFVPIPTVDLTVQFGELEDVGPWALGVFDHLRAADGYTVEDAELWSRDGRLVLSGRQLRRVLAPTAFPEAGTN